MEKRQINIGPFGAFFIGFFGLCAIEAVCKTYLYSKGLSIEKNRKKGD